MRKRLPVPRGLPGFSRRPTAGSVAAALAATAETARYLSGTGEIALRAPEDLDAILDAPGGGRARARSAGVARRWRRSSDRSDATATGIRRNRAAFPLLAGVAETAASFEREVADIRRKIDPGGEVVDDASPELRSLRDRLRKQRARLRGTLESYLRGKDTAKYLQQQIVTDRNGRFVLVVRSEHRTAIPGIVHGSSGSGASLYLEPLSTVEINNDIVALEQQEAEEVRRILLGAVGRVPASRHGVCSARSMRPRRSTSGRPRRATRMAIGGIRPAIVGRRPARAARGAASAAGRVRLEVIPVDMLLIPPTRVLVITGPNTGGKTVALKTAGLAADDGAGRPVDSGGRGHAGAGAAERVRRHRRRAVDCREPEHVFGHIANIVAMDKALVTPALVLLDEAGTGTDPNEGGALAMGDHRPLPAPRRDGGGDDALRHVEVVRVDDRRGGVGGIRVRP